MSTTSKAAMARRLRELGVTASVNTLRKYTREQLVGMVEQAERMANHACDRTPTHTSAPEPIPYATIAPPIPHLPLVPEGYGAIRVTVARPDTLTRVLGLLYGPVAILRHIVGL
jgi:hypothetical protein